MSILKSRIGYGLVGLLLAMACAATPQAAQADFSHSLYSFSAPGCRKKERVDPVSVVVSANNLSANSTASLASIWTGWGANVAGATGAYQYGRDHGSCTNFSNNNASAVEPLRSRYHVRWHLGNQPLSNGRNYVVGTPHYDKRCNTHHAILSFDGPRDIIARGAKRDGWDIYYTHENNYYVKSDQCLFDKYGAQAAFAVHDGNMLWVRPK